MFIFFSEQPEISDEELLQIGLEHDAKKNG